MNETNKSPEIILHVGAEGGSVTLCRRMTKQGARFYVSLVDQTLVILGEASESIEHDTELVETFEEGIKLLDKYPWRRLYPLSVHQEFRERVWSDIQNQHKSGLLDKSRQERWDRVCNPYGTPA